MPHMSLLRACLLSTTLLAGGFALAAEGPVGTVVMMPPVMDATGGGAGASTVRPSRLHYLTIPEHDLFSRAFEAAGRGDWVAARSIAAQGQNLVARRLLEWRYALDKNSGATFAEIDAVIRDTDAKGAAAWPLRGTLQARAEAAMSSDMTPAQVVAWFGGKNPNSSIGKIRLGEALVATGEKTRGALLIRQGWADGSFEPDVELAIVQKDAAYLTAADDRDRLDTLLWRGETSAARRVMARVDAATAEIANARIALTSGFPKAQAVVGKLRDSSDPGLLFDWSRQLRIADRDAEAHAMLLRVPAAPLVKDHAARWWAECNVQARDALTGGDPRLALKIAQHAGFTTGDQYAEQQFLAGFIALRFLKEPSTALTHFQKLDAAVARPISKSRAQYWQGRAYEALNDTAGALSHYRQAASYPETFYGQIALAHTDATPVLHLNDTAVEAAAASELETSPLMDAIKVLADLGQAGSLRAFIDRDVEVYSSPRHIKRLMLLLVDWGYPEIAVRLAKSASYAGAPMPAFTHPVIALPAYVGPGAAPEAPLVLGLIRQETEFDAYAVSGAGARGLMQMMPASARTAAKANNQPYRPEAVASDTVYNMQLGMAEWRGHMDRYGGSWVLAIASYNAGPGNVKKWLTAYGDPRAPESKGGDPIDWIEQIPFSETRNYVQRVLENTEVYRARLAGKDVPLRILSDLYAPNPPSMAVIGAK
ncbi:MAG: Lytic transglycosylase catalytic [Alphaproteobacteria bacterium]|nr:Lytic transglycosylase catalytic [Alphaproteobacteria bacterium]MDB5740895.1 Lytic transglycosylase catalytic [Alphaproteobacteria bacterium]